MSEEGDINVWGERELAKFGLEDLAEHLVSLATDLFEDEGSEAAREEVLNFLDAEDSITESEREDFATNLVNRIKKYNEENTEIQEETSQDDKLLEQIRTAAENNRIETVELTAEELADRAETKKFLNTYQVYNPEEEKLPDKADENPNKAFAAQWRKDQVKQHNREWYKNNVEKNKERKANREEKREMEKGRDAKCRLRKR